MRGQQFLDFTGKFTGTESTTASDVDSTFNDPKIQSLPLGTHVYSVTIGLYTPPGLPGTTLTGPSPRERPRSPLLGP